jgi:hypothetical protein
MQSSKSNIKRERERQTERGRKREKERQWPISYDKSSLQIGPIKFEYFPPSLYFTFSNALFYASDIPIFAK